jgi:hypothetical protein
MPYLRLYSREEIVAIEQKRVITQKLIEITLRSFHLARKESNRITIQFIAATQESGGHGPQSAIPRGADLMLEVMAHHLTENEKRGFAEEVIAVLPQLIPTRIPTRIAHLLGIRADPRRYVALQFNELSPAVSDPWQTLERRAA